jgi:hypothetical protein
MFSSAACFGLPKNAGCWPLRAVSPKSDIDVSGTDVPGDPIVNLSPGRSTRFSLALSGLWAIERSQRSDSVIAQQMRSAGKGMKQRVFA